MKKRIIASILGLILLVSLLPVSVLADGLPTYLDVKLNVTYGQTEARAMLDYINKFRAGNDVDGQRADYLNQNNTTKTDLTGQLQPLEYDYDLEKVAMQRAAEIAMMFSHDRPDGSQCWTAWGNLGSNYNVAENIAAGQTTAYEAFQSWREDNEKYDGQGHRRNMLTRSCTKIGIGHVVYKGNHYWTQAFYDGSQYNNNVKTTANDDSANVTITVKSAYIRGFQTEIKPDSYEMKPGEKARVPKVSVSYHISGHVPGGYIDAAMNVNWTSSNSDVVSIQSGKIIAVKEGSAELMASVYGKTLKVPVTVEIHDLKKTKAKASTCIKEGNIAYWTCSKCHRVYSDANGTKEISLKDIILPLADHKRGSAVIENKVEQHCYDVSGTYDEVIYCTVCKKELSRTHKIIPCKRNTVKIIKGSAVAPTCTKSGRSEKRKCTVCGKVYEGDLLAALGHNWGEWKVVKKPTATSEGLEERICKRDHNHKETRIIAKVPQKYIDSATVKAKAQTYTGKKLTPVPTVKLGSVTLKKGTDYSVTYSNNVNAGTATITVTGKGNYKGTATGTFTINKAANTLTINKSKATYKQSALKNGKKTFNIGAANAKGTLTYMPDAAAKKAGITVTKAGKVTVPKGCKAGTYKIAVKAAGNKNYKEGNKTVTIKVTK